MAFELSQFYSVTVAAGSFIRSLRVSYSPGLCRNSTGSVAARVRTFLGFLDRVRFPMTQSPPVSLFWE